MTCFLISTVHLAYEAIYDLQTLRTIQNMRPSVYLEHYDLLEVL